MLLTNDGDWAQRMLHPSHGVEREYAVGVDSPLTSAQREHAGRGRHAGGGDGPRSRTCGPRPPPSCALHR